MCGIAGVINSSNLDLKKIISPMLDAIIHRGPDDSGIEILANGNVALGHRRLAILDLSVEGHQPMFSPSGRYSLIFNGEIYNFKSLRKQLENLITFKWRGHSDTEVLLALIEFYGFEKALDKINGMFAIACFDSKNKQVYLARDRMGEKPLYYGLVNNCFVFASELKAIVAFENSNLTISTEAIQEYLQFSYVPAPLSIYKEIYKLLPGHYLTIDSQDYLKASQPKPYWQLDNKTEKLTLNDAKPILENILLEVIQEQMISDRPLGSFLSGGIDSSLVTALMQRCSSKPINTFSIGFNEAAYNEAPFAKAVAEHLGCQHHEKIFQDKDAFKIIDLLPQIYDEPFADSSQLPTYLVSGYAKQKVTVALTGDGADELFGGYVRYMWTSKIWRTIGWLPVYSRRLIAKILSTLPDKALKIIVKGLPKSMRFSQPQEKIRKLCSLLPLNSGFSIYKQLVSTFNNSDELLINDYKDSKRFDDLYNHDLNFVEAMMELDANTYLPDDIMVKVDRAAMHHSLETRAPFLDKRVVEFANKLPLDLKVNHGQSKLLLRQILYDYIPKEIIDRPKMGFGIPINTWLRGPLKPWLESLFFDEHTEALNYIDKSKAIMIYQDFMNSKNNNGHQLWNLAMLYSWFKHWQTS